MKKIIYEKLRVQNFLSIGKDTIEINFQNGLNMITGANLDNPERKNAIGKSSLIEAYYYSLFGTTIRKLKKEKVINNVTKGAGLLELFFSVQTENSINSYKIIRKLKPSSVELWKLGEKEENITKDSIDNTNKYICDLIGSNPTISKSCDIISLTDNISFMSMTPEVKRKFNEDIFTLEVFGKILKDLKEKIKDNKSNINISSSKIEEITKSLNTLNEQYIIQKNNVEQRSLRLEEKRIDLSNIIKECEGELNTLEILEIDHIVSENEKLHNAWSKIDGLIGDVNVKISVNHSEEERLISTLYKRSKVSESVCDKCFQNITHDHIELITAQNVDIQESIKLIQEEICKLQTEKTNLQEKKRKIQSKLSENQDSLKQNERNVERGVELKNKIELSKSFLESLDTQIENQESGLDTFLESIEVTQDRLDDEKVNLENLKQVSDDLETCRFIVGDDGVKSMIVKKLLDMLNASIQHYISKLGMNMRCKFDEYFEETITNDKGDELSYWNLSGGERRTIDISCSWAFKDIKRKISGVSSNVEFLDEVMDSAFDAHGMDLLIETLKNRIETYGLACYTISHRPETCKHIDGETVFLEKHNRITRRKSYLT